MSRRASGDLPSRRPGSWVSLAARPQRRTSLLKRSKRSWAKHWPVFEFQVQAGITRCNGTISQRWSYRAILPSFQPDFHDAQISVESREVSARRTIMWHACRTCLPCHHPHVSPAHWPRSISIKRATYPAWVSLANVRQPHSPL